VSVEQASYQIRFDWGMAGAAAIASDADVVVWVDAVASSQPMVDTDQLATTAAVLAVDLRTAAAAARWVAALQTRLGRRIAIAVVAAGEERDAATMRYAAEDQLVAGAVIASLGRLGIDATSPEAAVAEAAYRGLERAIGHVITASVGGRASPVTTADTYRVDPELTEASVVVLRPHPQE
jgi:hypothetical protein